MKKKAIIIGAGPAGLTAAYELLQRTDIIPVILERSGDIGGISKTVNYKGNRMDIGGHRFFSKSDKVMKWWLNILPLENNGPSPFEIKYRQQTTTITPSVPADPSKAATDKDRVMMVRNRLSRIYYLRRFFSYPVTLSVDTVKKLGIGKMIRIGISYCWSKIHPVREERSLEDFFINRFGRNLYKTFFKDYTEKVWGISCKEISAEWGAQRIKKLSVSKAVAHAIRQKWPFKKDQSVSQKSTNTSLIEKFLYPKYGPGQLWEEVARLILEKGGEIHLHQQVQKIRCTGTKVDAVITTDASGKEIQWEGDHFFSTMPVKDLVAGLQTAVPAEVTAIAGNLQYRDFIIVGVLLSKLTVKNDRNTEGDLIKDNWIYIQEKEVKLGRLQVFNNWSPFMVKDADTVWLGLEYFCNEGDELWSMADDRFMDFAILELEKIGIISAADVLDKTIVRMEKTYPAYFGAYQHFDKVKEYLNGFSNLYLIGRNGMHKYNNSDHSMLTAMTAVDNIVNNISTRDNIWAINTEDEYHEEK